MLIAKCWPVYPLLLLVKACYFALVDLNTRCADTRLRCSHELVLVYIWGGVGVGEGLSAAIVTNL